MIICKKQTGIYYDSLKSAYSPIELDNEQKVQPIYMKCTIIIACLLDFAESLMDNPNIEISIFTVSKILSVEIYLNKLIIFSCVPKQITEIRSKIELINQRTKSKGPVESVNSEIFGEIYYNTDFVLINFYSAKGSMQIYLKQILEDEFPAIEEVLFDVEILIIQEALRVFINTRYSDDLSFSLHDEKVYDYESLVEDSEESTLDNENFQVRTRAAKTYKNTLLFKYTK